jgi:hypothetical protein
VFGPVAVVIRAKQESAIAPNLVADDAHGAAPPGCQRPRIQLRQEEAGEGRVRDVAVVAIYAEECLGILSIFDKHLHQRCKGHLLRRLVVSSCFLGRMRTQLARIEKPIDQIVEIIQ